MASKGGEDAAWTPVASASSVKARLAGMPDWVTDRVPPDQFDHVPQRLWIGIGLLVVAGLFALLPALLRLPDALSLMSDGELGRAFGLIALVAIILIGSCGVACLYLATLLYRADRAGRVLTLAVAGCLVAGELFSDDMGGSGLLVLLGSAAVIVVLTALAEVREYFTGQYAHQTEVPTPVVASRAIVVALAFVLGVVGIAYLPVSTYDGKYLVIGAILVAVAVVGFTQASRVLRGDDMARKVITGLMALDIVTVLSSDPSGAGLWVPVGLAGVVVGLLWGPQESRDFFESRR